MEEHLANLLAVFQKLSAAGFKLNFEKCAFFQEKIQYLGHVIDKNGLHKDNSKVSAILNAPQPKTQTQVKAFIGLVNYYAKFIPNLAKLLAPIYALLKKENKFIWSKECENAFELVKSVISSDKVLAHYDPNRPIKLICDASQDGIGAALFHVFENGEERPVCFASRTLNCAEKNYAVIDREALAIYFGVRKFMHYLLGRKFILQTDHRPLVSIFGTKKGIPVMAASRLQRWSVYLSNFDFEIQYIVGKNNVNADFLSRFPKTSKELTSINDSEQTYLNFIDATSKSAINSDTIKKRNG